MRLQPDHSAVSDPNDVSQQLIQMGLSIPLLHTAAQAGGLARLGVSGLHPPTTAGFLQWSDGVAVLREKLLPLGWELEDVENRGLTFNRQVGIVIAVAGGDADTGRLKGTPTTRAKRGPATKRSIDANARQQELFPEYFERPRSIRDKELGEFWLLLIHVDRQRVEIRSEFSRPIGWSEDERPSGLSPRLVLPAIPFGDGGTKQVANVPISPQTPEVKIEIKRRA